MWWKITATTVAALALLIVACESGPAGPSLPIKVLKAAPETLAIAGRDYTLETRLNRDFFPLCPPDGRPLTVVAHVVAAGEEAFPAALDADRVWVVNGEEVWEASLVDGKVPAPANELVRSASNGPRWKPDLYVDVVVRLLDTKGNMYLIRAADQKIGMSR